MCVHNVSDITVALLSVSFCTCRLHLETSSVLLRQFPIEFLERPLNWRYAPMSAAVPVGKNQFIQLSEGQVILGKPTDFPSFGWDNEYGKAMIQYVYNLGCMFQHHYYNYNTK